MKYFSTRDRNLSVYSAEVAFRGISAEGGLFVPEGFPKFDWSRLEFFKGLSYEELAFEILSLFFDDFSVDELLGCIKKAYSSGKFSKKDVLDLVRLDDSRFVLELWHGPTCAFKDVALQFLPHLLSGSIKKRENLKELLVLVATSGDTGKAALEGFKNVDGFKVLVFFPENGVSKMQKLQMTTQDGENLAVCSINGNFDDAQSGVKALLTDENLVAALGQRGVSFSSANSINWGRLAPQIVYYFYSYCKLLKDGRVSKGEEVNFAVPTGNFGDVLAGYYAKKMGLPIKNLIVASNSNNALTEFINTGVYDRNRKFFCTMSPSIDILVSSNLERLIFDFCLDCESVKEKYFKLAEYGFFDVEGFVLKKIKENFYGNFSTEEETRTAIAETFKRYGYLCDPHTGVAFSVYEKYLNETKDRAKTIIVSTANPFKFAKDVGLAVGCSLDQDEFGQLENLSEFAKLKIPANLMNLKNKNVRFNQVIEKGDMKKYLLKFLNF